MPSKMLQAKNSTYFHETSGSFRVWCAAPILEVFAHCYAMQGINFLKHTTKA